MTSLAEALPPLSVPADPVAPSPSSPPPSHEPAPPAASAEPAPSSTEPAAPAPPPSLLEQLVRTPAEFLARLDEPDAADRARALLLAVAFGACLFGVVLGAYRGGVQVLYCAAKVPLLLLGTLVLCTPAFVGIAYATDTKISWRAVIMLTLGASARLALVLAGLAPVVWLVQAWLSYHELILAIVAACGVAGLAAAGLLFRGLSRARGAATLAGLAFVAVYGLVGLQTAWLLRPFVVRPRTAHVPFVRAIEGDLVDSVRTTARSAAGVYDRSAPPPSAPAAPVAREPGRSSCEGASCD